MRTATALIWFGLSAPAGIAVGGLLGNPWLVAVLPVILMYPAYWRGLGERPAAHVFGFSLLWAAAVSASIICWTQLSSGASGAAILRGIPYREEMFAWLHTGVGAEGDPRQFLPQHAAHLGLFVIASLASGGLLGLLMGSVLMGYMSFYVGSVALASGRPLLGAVVGWHPWSVLRVIGFVACGVALSLPLRQRRLRAVDLRLLLVGLALVVVDAVVKALLAETWRNFLLSLM
jgi:hypothetical protein